METVGWTFPAICSKTTRHTGAEGQVLPPTTPPVHEDAASDKLAASLHLSPRLRAASESRWHGYSDISFGMCLSLMSWVQQVHNAAVVARSLGCQCDTEMPILGRTLTETSR